MILFIIFLIPLYISEFCKETVSCCFTFHSEIKEIYLNEKNITNKIYPNYALKNYKIMKYITFDEPNETSLIAIKANNFNEVIQSSFQMNCKSTDVTSPWNTYSDVDRTWKVLRNPGVANLDKTDRFDNTFYMFNYTGNVYNVDYWNSYPYFPFDFFNKTCEGKSIQVKVFKYNISPTMWFVIRKNIKVRVQKPIC